MVLPSAPQMRLSHSQMHVRSGTFRSSITVRDGTLYFLDGATGKLMTTGQDYSEEGLVNWSATLCQMDETSHGRKCYSKLYLRADLEAGASGCPARADAWSRASSGSSPWAANIKGVTGHGNHPPRLPSFV